MDSSEKSAIYSGYSSLEGLTELLNRSQGK
jgi:hypothetical protein